MNNRKESEIIDRISELTNKPKSTLYDWKKSEKNIKVYEALKEYIELKDNKKIDINSSEYMINEIASDLEKLPPGQIKILYYTIKTKLAEMGL